MSRVTVRDATIRLLRALGMTTVFGNPRLHWDSVFKGWPKDFRYIMGLQEASVVGMADGYAQATRRAALVSLPRHGRWARPRQPVTASANGTPLVVIAGQQSRALLPTSLTSTPSPPSSPRMREVELRPAPPRDPAAIARASTRRCNHPGPTFVSPPVDDWDARQSPWSAR